MLVTRVNMERFFHQDSKAAIARRRQRANQKLGIKVKPGRPRELNIKPASEKQREYRALKKLELSGGELQVVTPKKVVVVQSEQAKPSTSAPSQCSVLKSVIQTKKLVQQTISMKDRVSFKKASAFMQQSVPSFLTSSLEEDIEMVRTQMLSCAKKAGATKFLPYLASLKARQQLYTDFWTGQKNIMSTPFPGMMPDDVMVYMADPIAQNGPVQAINGVAAQVDDIQITDPPKLKHPFKLLLVGDSECGKSTAAARIVQTPFMDLKPTHIYLLKKENQAVYDALIGNYPSTSLQKLVDFDPSSAQRESLMVVDDFAFEIVHSLMFTVLLWIARHLRISIMVSTPRLFSHGRFAVDQRRLYTNLFLFKSAFKHPKQYLNQLYDSTPATTLALDDLVQKTPFSFLALDLRPARKPDTEPLARASRFAPF